MKQMNQVSEKASACHKNGGFILIGAAVAVLLYLELAKPIFSDDELLQSMISMTLTRGIGAAVFLVALLSLGYRVASPLPKPFGRAMLFCFPALAVVVNNAPLLGLLWGNVTVTGSVGHILWFLAECVAIGLFEELAFRGVILLMIVEYWQKKRPLMRRDLFAAIALSSAVFGAIHLVNIFLGGDPGAVLLQIGYSFLVGAMCAVVLFRTANIWLCVLLHAVYDVGGNMVGRIAEGRMWDTPTVIITVILAVATVVFYTVALWRMRPADVERLVAKTAKRDET